MEVLTLKILKIAVIFLMLYGNSFQGELCPVGYYKHWKPEDNDFICCRAVFVEQGYEGIPCKLNGTEDTIRKCPPGTVQPDRNFSEHALECTVELDCPEGAKKKLHCDGAYCWHICICDLESGRCGTQFLNCDDISKIDCSGKIEEDCSCSLPYTTSTTSQSTLLSSVLMKTYTTEIQTNISGTTPSVGKTSDTEYRNTRDKSTEDTGSTVSQVIYIGGAILAVVIIITSVVYAKIHEHRRLGRLNTPAENEHHPLLNNNNGDIHIQMGCLNKPHIESTPVPGAQQESDLDDQSGNVDSDTELLEEQDELESEDEHQPLHNHIGNIYLQVEGLNLNSIPVPGGEQESDPDDQSGSIDTIPESKGEQVESESGETSVAAERVARVLPIVRRQENSPSSNQTMSENPISPYMEASNYDTEYMPPIFPSLGPSLRTDSLQSSGQDQVQVPREANTGSHSRETLSQNWNNSL